MFDIRNLISACNAAVSTQVGDFLEATQAQIQKMWEINFMSTFLLIQ